jgi:2-amino-4-hydroxy-6-hydroxymethyldihydropteridine diphosphokinase
MPVAFLGIGSNIGDRYGYLKKALEKIGNVKGIKFINCSSIYETEPWGIREQKDFLNCVFQIETILSPGELISELKSIETELGRKNNVQWREREIDIDILFYDDLVYKDEILEIPHSEIADRKFVLIPMYEIAPDFIHPSKGVNISEMLESTKDTSKVVKQNLILKI